MKKKHKIVLLGLTLLVLIIGFTYYRIGQRSDKCTAVDKAQNNCVPAGRCAPPGDPREATVDCALKNYDHEFKQQ